MAQTADSGIVEIPSHHSVDQTVEKLKGIPASKERRAVCAGRPQWRGGKSGHENASHRLLSFGNPKAGTPVMLTAPSSAIDLPLKILIREDYQGRVWVSYNSPAYLQRRHNLPQDLLQNLAVVEALATKAGE